MASRQPLKLQRNFMLCNIKHEREGELANLFGNPDILWKNFQSNTMTFFIYITQVPSSIIIILNNHLGELETNEI